MRTILRVLYLNILLNFIIVEVLFSLCPIHSTLCVWYLAHTGWAARNNARVRLGAKTAKDILNFVCMPLNCKFSPRLEHYRNDVLHTSADKKQGTHRIYKVVVFLKFIHEFVFGQQLKLTPTCHQIF